MSSTNEPGRIALVSAIFAGVAYVGYSVVKKQIFGSKKSKEKGQ